MNNFMARKLNLYESEAFKIVLTEGMPSEPHDAETVFRALMDKRNEALELSPESNRWFGDIPPGTPGNKR
jgi:hypothetical protein